MAHIRREGAMSMQQSSTNSSMSSSQQSSSYSSNVNRASSSSTTAQYADSRGHAASGEVQNGQRYYVEDNFGGRKYIDGPPQQPNEDKELQMRSTPDSGASSPPPSQQESVPISQPALQSKPKATYSPKKGNVRIVLQVLP